jgi:hypothetical protein
LTSDAALRLTLLVAAISALLVVLGLFGGAVRVLCLVLIGAAALLTAPPRVNRGGAWWRILAGGAAASIAGAIIAQPAPTLGGWIALLGGLAVIVAAAVGFSVEEEPDA